MFIYIIAVFSVVAITSLLLLLLFKKFKLLNFRTVSAIAFSSVLSGLLFPGIFNLISTSRPGAVDIPILLFILLSTLLLYIVLTFILGIIISFVIPEGLPKPVMNREAEGQPQRHEGDVQIENSNINGADNLLADIYSSHITENGEKDANTGDNTLKGENNLEISVDSAENIDKMGLESLGLGETMLDEGIMNTDFIEEDTRPLSERIPKEDGLEAAENLSVNDCVNEAFRLKELGDLEGSILYYMYALDRKPLKDLVFWIVLDICVLYKSLGQIDFAHEMLSVYVGNYDDMMDNSVREEIERNLLNIQN